MIYMIYTNNDVPRKERGNSLSDASASFLAIRIVKSNDDSLWMERGRDNRED